MECPSCRGENPDGARFCMSCGKSMSATCPECGIELPAEARFCLNCGHQLGQAQADPARARLEQYIPRELLTKLETARTTSGPQGERRVVTMLFCDVTGSTAAMGGTKETSPTPRTPRGWPGLATSTITVSIMGRSKLMGIR